MRQRGSYLDFGPKSPERAAEVARAYIERGFEGELRRAAMASGGRNIALNAAAFAIGGMVGAGWVDENVAVERLMEAATANGLAESDGTRQCLQTIRSGLSKGKLQPRSLPPHLASADLSGLNVRPMSPEAVAEARALAQAKADEAAAIRRSVELDLREARYLERCAAALHDHADALAELRRRRIDEDTAAAFQLGWDAFPLPDAPEHYGPKGRRPSIVMPWLDIDAPERIDALQYRHLGPIDGRSTAKVHWHHELHPGHVFNGVAVSDPHDSVLFVVEGALAACTLHSAGITSVVGLPQLRTGRDTIEGLAARMKTFDRVYWMPDKGGLGVWRDYAAMVPDGRGVVRQLPLDPDDFLIATGGNADLFWRVVSAAC